MSTLAHIVRPASWNAKMVLSGQPLITDAQFEKLLANAPKSLEEMEYLDPVPVVKIFLPHMRWLLAWIYPKALDRCFGAAMLGPDEPEIGDMLLSDIVRSRLGTGALGIAPERDKYIKLDKPVSWYVEHPDAW